MKLNIHQSLMVKGSEEWDFAGAGWFGNTYFRYHPDIKMLTASPPKNGAFEYYMLYLELESGELSIR